MNNDVNAARQKLVDGDYTCVVLVGNREYCSFERGVKPLLSLLQSEVSYREAVAADKTVGAGAAYLYVLLGVRAVWANVISDAAWDVLKNHGIDAMYGERVAYIINRRGDGMCPIEAAVAGAKTPAEAYRLITEKLEELSKQ